MSRSEEESAIIYEYDAELYLNVIKINGRKRPFIEINNNDVELMTKTKTTRERDDDPTFVKFKTNNNESVDGDKKGSQLLELETKTLQARERDDVRNDYLLELNTKTRVQKERDDEHFNHN